VSVFEHVNKPDRKLNVSGRLGGDDHGGNLIIITHEVGVGITVVRIIIYLTSYIPTRFEKLSCNRELRLECSCCS
jgi:hypothetical protein